MAAGKGISELTALTEVTGSDLFIVTDDTSGNSRKVSWTDVEGSIDTIPGDVTFTTSSSVTPTNNGDLVIEATNNTTLTFKLKGSDGTVRSGTLTLS